MERGRKKEEDEKEKEKRGAGREERMKAASVQQASADKYACSVHFHINVELDILEGVSDKTSSLTFQGEQQFLPQILGLQRFSLFFSAFVLIFFVICKLLVHRVLKATSPGSLCTA